MWSWLCTRKKQTNSASTHIWLEDATKLCERCNEEAGAFLPASHNTLPVHLKGLTQVPFTMLNLLQQSVNDEGMLQTNTHYF